MAQREFRPGSADKKERRRHADSIRSAEVAKIRRGRSPRSVSACANGRWHTPKWTRCRDAEQRGVTAHLRTVSSCDRASAQQEFRAVRDCGSGDLGGRDPGDRDYSGRDLSQSPNPMMQASQIIPTRSVYRSRFFSATDEPARLVDTPPPNMLESPPPLPRCRRISNISNKLVTMSRTTRM